MNRTNNISNKNNAKQVIFELLFYVVLATIVLFVWMTVSSSNAPKRIFGFSFCSVLTGSMQSEIPIGSLVLVRQVDPNTLEIGDDITYMRSANTTVTHRIIDIIENYQGTGKRGFQTKGIENTIPDLKIVMADNIVGKVVFHNLVLGKILSFIKQNLWLCALQAVFILGLFASLNMVFSSKETQKDILVEQNI